MTDRMSEIAQALSERLQARRKLVDLAREIVNQIPDTPEPVGVDDVAYTNCADSGVEYICYGYGAYGGYAGTKYPTCPRDVAFICKRFACAELGFEFHCENTLDHACTDEFACSQFDHDNRHTCGADHGFFCDDDFQCHADFQCKARGLVCDPAQYHLQDSKDTTPGDFLCGWPGGSLDDFDCNSDFRCNAADDFRCVDSTEFGCGRGDTIDRFACGLFGEETQFQCAGIDFRCDPFSRFECLGEFQCRKNEPFSCAYYSCPWGVEYKNDSF